MTGSSTRAAESAELRFRVRGLEITLTADPPSLLQPLRHLAVFADDDDACQERLSIHYTVDPDGRPLLQENGSLPRPVCCASVVPVNVHNRINRRVLQTYRDYTCLHSGSVTIDGRLVLLTGDRGSGKSTLLLRLLLDGADFHGDEYVLARKGRAYSLPRPLHVKRGTLELLPEVRAACVDKPVLQFGGNLFFRLLEPSDLGVRWRSADTRPAAIVHLQPDFLQSPEIVETTQIAMVKNLMCQTLSGAGDTGRQVQQICDLVRGVRCYELRVGELRETAAVVRDMVRQLGHPSP